MGKRHVRFATSGLLSVFALALVGCPAGVTQDDLDAELAQVRQEMNAGDDQLSSRIDELNRRVSTLESELQQLRNDFDVTMENAMGMLRFNVPVHFDFDRADIRELDEPVLDRFAEVVKEYYADALITVEGFADPAGSEAYNIQLGKRRADAVKRYLTTAGGMPADQVKTVSYGESPDRQVVPGARGPGVTGIENRRVALVVDYGGSVRGTGM
ncbi:MAG: OmpA family protein [Gemmatimonadetes bacterium]|uniref:OmpA family protein n=1 Tax=Candidatus Kutchimonas denitrificans TaxID=3056748 RepID=A0AAE4Z5E4_9BACT|nr:OmpA family protein [Gemmatimonadota bacterium]NIR74109.1 OmpA family protein [Candidatus Kutchimonas denitrificans]NIS01291.1 OmpA family protein [Gemmatimonadota bacterium]NIT67022.1 OmpA family protein [Gemmatimonadota bacterium]NIU51682.1 OmpA family protein [Gemmatimonadota bacterium]